MFSRQKKSTAKIFLKILVDMKLHPKRNLRYMQMTCRFTEYWSKITPENYPVASNRFLKIFIGVELIYNAVLVSGVQQSDSVIHTHISTFFFFFGPFPT